MRGIALVLAYLFAIVAANLLVARYGPSVTVINALVFVAFDISTRDALHDRWYGRGLWPRMAALIVAGSALSYALNAGAGRIALASCAAFALSGAADALAYGLLGRRPWWQRSNGSNLVSAAVDSAIFPYLAFGAVLPWVMAGQFAAKVAGGAFWSWALGLWRGRRAAVGSEATR